MGGGPPCFPQGFPVSRGTLDPARLLKISPTGLSPSLAGFPKTVPLSLAVPLRSPQPRSACTAVWASSISLAATLEIDVSFSSSPYLDVSVQAVPLHTLWIGVWIHEVFSCGFPHSDISGSMDICSSPEAFRSLSRPSSALSAKGIHPAPFMLDLLNELFTHLWPPFRHSVGFRVLPHELLPHPLSPLGCGCQIPSIRSHGRPSSGLFWFVRYFRNASDVFPISLRFTLGYRFCICGFQGTSPDGIIRRDGSLLPGPSGFFRLIACLHASG